MNQPENGLDIERLIDQAATYHATKAALAKALGVSGQRLNSWRNGIEPCPPEYVALIAHEAKLPADQWLARAVLWRSAGKKTEEALKRALGKSLRATGAALALCMAVALWGSFDNGQDGLFSPT